MSKTPNMDQKVGIDVVDISRFKPFIKNKEHSFLKKVFFSSEIDYCFKYRDTAVHLAGLFVAKEAVSKALGVKKFPYIEIEVRHDKSGAPEVWKGNKKLPISLSISHTKSIAVAIAIR